MKFNLREVVGTNLTSLDTIENRQGQISYALFFDKYILGQTGNQFAGFSWHQNHDQLCFTNNENGLAFQAKANDTSDSVDKMKMIRG